MTPHTRNARILSIYHSYTRPLVDREVMEELGFKDMNSVRPRITELIKAKKLIPTGRREDGITHRLVRLVTAVRPRETQPLFKGLS